MPPTPTTAATRPNCAAAVAALLALLPCGCSAELASPPADLLPVGTPTAEPGPRPVAVAVPDSGQATMPPAAPAGERALTDAPEAATEPAAASAPRLVAIGRTANELGAAALLPATPTGGALPSIVDDRDAIELLRLGKVDFALSTATPSAGDRRAGLCATPLGVELWVLAVADGTAVHRLDRNAAQRLLDGSIRDWGAVGAAAGPIALGVPREPRARARALRALLPGGTFAAAAVPVDSARGAFDLLLRVPGAAVVVPLVALPTAGAVHALAIDGMAPSPAAYGLGTYRAGTPLWLVTIGAPRDGAAALLREVQRGAVQPAPDRLSPGW